MHRGVNIFPTANVQCKGRSVPQKTSLLFLSESILVIVYVEFMSITRLRTIPPVLPIPDTTILQAGDTDT